MMNRPIFAKIAVIATFLVGCGGGGGGGGDTAYVTLATGGDQILDIAVDLTHVYWVDAVQGWVKKVPLDGGEVVTLATDQPSPASIAVDSQYVYWASVNSGGVMKIPLAGGAPTSVTTEVHSGSFLAIDATHAYWRSGGTGIHKAPLAGGAIVTLCEQSLSGIGRTTDLAVDSTHVYWSDDYGLIFRVPVDGGTEEEIANHWDLMGSYGEFLSIALDSTHVYWTNGEMVGKVPLSGGQMTAIASGQLAAGRIALDFTDVYWIDGALEGGTLMRAPRDGGTPTIVATELGVAFKLHVGSSRVYWSTITTIRSISKY